MYNVILYYYNKKNNLNINIKLKYIKRKMSNYNSDSDSYQSDDDIYNDDFQKNTGIIVIKESTKPKQIKEEEPFKEEEPIKEEQKYGDEIDKLIITMNVNDVTIAELCKSLHELFFPRIMIKYFYGSQKWAFYNKGWTIFDKSNHDLLNNLNRQCIESINDRVKYHIKQVEILNNDIEKAHNQTFTIKNHKDQIKNIKDQTKHIEDKIKSIEKTIKKFNTIINKLSTESYRKKIGNVLQNAGFGYGDLSSIEDTFDKNNNIIKFNNCIYLITEKIFRDESPFDYVLKSIPITINRNLSNVDTIIDEIKTIFTHPFIPNNLRSDDKHDGFNVANFFLKKISNIINKQLTKRDQYMNFLLGYGSNGKSTIFDIVTTILGSHNITSANKGILIDNPSKTQSSSANSALMALKGLGGYYFNEIQGAVIDAGLFKELTGGDKISTRGLFQDQTTFIAPNTSFYLSNELPQFNSIDYAVTRRIMGIEFKTQYLDIIDQSNPWHRKRDDTLINKLKEDADYQTAFIHLLIKYFYEDPIVPMSCKTYTQDFMKQLDQYTLFCGENIIQDEHKSITLCDIWDSFKIYVMKELDIKDYEISKKFKRKDLLNYLKQHYASNYKERDNNIRNVFTRLSLN